MLQNDKSVFKADTVSVTSYNIVFGVWVILAVWVNFLNQLRFCVHFQSTGIYKQKVVIQLTTVHWRYEKEKDPKLANQSPIRIANFVLTQTVALLPSGFLKS